MMFGNKWESFEAPHWLADDLCDLSEALGKANPENQAHGVLGGAWGYGQEYDGPVFEMHPYFWGACECGYAVAEDEWETSHSHAEDCYQSEMERRGGLDFDTCDALAIEYGLPVEGSAVHCTCSHDADYAKWRDSNDHDPRCREVLPNFLHKSSALAVHWYKYIGRSMTANRELTKREWRVVFDECLASLESGDK
jgi:hypothetical protein